MKRVVLAGKPNVGKSSLFNVLAGREHSIVADIPGVTRDALEKEVTINKKPVLLSDVGGLGESVDELHSITTQRAWDAIKEADLVIFVLDIHLLDNEDRVLLRKLQAMNKETLYTVNKADTDADDHELADIYRLGISDPLLISCETKRNIAQLREKLAASLAAIPEKEQITTILPKQVQNYDFRLSIIGKPNAGKSSLLNALLGKERAMVSEIAGTTRDSVIDFLHWQDKTIRLTDTAGLRRKGRKRDHIESASLGKAIGSIGASDLNILVLDGSEDNITEQDKKIAAVTARRNKAIIIAVNKTDLMKDVKWQSFEERLRSIFPHIGHVPVVPISSKTGKNIDKLMNKVISVWQEYNTEIQTTFLNELIQEAVRAKAPRRGNTGPCKILYAVQVKTAPVTISVFVNSSRKMYSEYERYLINFLRKRLGLEGVPVAIHFRSRKKEQDQ